METGVYEINALFLSCDNLLRQHVNCFKWVLTGLAAQKEGNNVTKTDVDALNSHICINALFLMH